MEIKLKEVEEILIGLNRIKFKMPTKTAYWLGIFNRKLKEHYEEYSEKRRDLLEKYGEKGEDGKFVMLNESLVKLKDSTSYNREIKELNNIEIDIPFRPMPMESFFPPEKVKDGKEEKAADPLCDLVDMEVLGRFMIPLGE